MKDKLNYDLYFVTISFVSEVLGTQPQFDVATEFITSAYEEGGGEMPSDEQETFDRAVEKGTTAFHKLNGQPILYDYQIKGFIKEAGRIFNGLDQVKALRSKIDNLVFVEPRRLALNIPAGGKIEYLERPLRAETAQGPRVALARSEMLPIGTSCEFRLKVFESQITESILRALLSYGENKGIGQWRNGGWGRFTFEMH